MLTDPIVMVELTVIVGCIPFYLWWFSPTERRKRDLRNREAEQPPICHFCGELIDHTDTKPSVKHCS